MHKKGGTVQEIAAFAEIMRAFAPKIIAPRSKPLITIDSCGTGGGTVPTFNISTAVAFVLAAAGLKVAKHGNRAITSRSGSADVLEALGVSLDLTPREVGNCIKEIGIGFLFAPHFHKATRFVQPVRKQLSHKTFFNILGPLTNPSAPKYQIVGVYSPELTIVMARVLQKLGVRRAMVIHGRSIKKTECLDEVSLLGPTKITELKGGEVRTYSFDPRRYGYKYCTKAAIAGGTAKQNAVLLKNILQGKEKGPRKDIVALNAATGLLVSGKARTFAAAIKLSEDIIASGKAYEKITELVQITQQRRKA